MKIRNTLQGFARLLLVMVVAVSLSTVAGCGDKRSGGEKAGEKIDDAIDNTKDVFDKDGPVEDAGEKVDKKLGND